MSGDAALSDGAEAGRGRMSPRHKRPRQSTERRPMAALEEAARRVLRERSGEWSRAALSPSEAEELMGHLLAFVQMGKMPEGLELDGAQKTLVRRLVDLIRQELLSTRTGLSDSTVLGLVRKLDRARAGFDPDRHQALASQLTGANALDLVVELTHDLRSPLTSIMFLSETLRKGQSGEINEVQRKQLGIVYSAALGLVTMASDMMDLAREGAIAEQHRAEPAPFSVSELVEAVRLMVAPMAEEKRLDLTFLTPSHDVRIGKTVPLSRILLNLVTNAIKFTEEGSVEIVVREQAGSAVEFSIRDTGRGMDEETLESMYEPFQRTRSSTGFHFSGTGLGLSICRRMVELLGGELEVESRPDEGTRFYFEIDLPRGSRV